MGSLIKRDDIPGLGPGVGRYLLLELGPVFFALAFNYFLLGALLVQTYNYYQHFKRDSKWLKIFVYSVVVMDLLQTALSSHATFHTFVLYYGTPAVTQMPAKTIMSLFLFGGLVGGCVQLFYAWRIWTLAKSFKSIWFIAYVVVVVCTATLSTVCAVTAAALDVIVDDQADLYGAIISKLLAIWFAASFAVDALIAIAMVFIVSSAKTNTSFKRTQDILGKILLRAVATGLATAALNCLEIPLFFVWPNTDLGELPVYIGGKVYSNTLLVTLNARYTDSEAYSSHGPMFTSNFNSSGPQVGGNKTMDSMKFTPPIKLDSSSHTRVLTDVSGHTDGTIHEIESNGDIHLRSMDSKRRGQMI